MFSVMKTFAVHMSNRRKKTVNNHRLYAKTKISGVTTRKPFQDKGNFMSISCEDEKNKPTTLSSRTARKRSYLNSNSNAISRKKMPLPSNSDNTVNISPSAVDIEEISVEDLSKLSSFDPSVLLEHLSEEDLRTHLKECNVIVTDILQEQNQKKTAKKGDELEGVNMFSDNTSENRNQNKRVSLRKRKYNIDYAQFNRGSSLAKQPIQEHVPVYKKEVKEKVKVPNDVYDFDSDSENKKSKRKKRKKTLDMSVPFEKHMKIEMRKIELKDKKPLKRTRRRAVNNKEKCLLNDVKTKITRRNLEKNQQDTKMHAKNAKIVIPVCNEMDVERNDLDLSDVDSAPLELEICTEEKSTSVNIINKNCVPDPRINILQDIQLTTKNNENTDVSVEESKENCHTKFDELFDFDTLKSPIGKSTPWRPNLQVRRNPFFLQYKETSLPSYNQDMVIDSTAEEKASLGNKTPKNLFPNPTKTKQTSILSFVNAKNPCDSHDVFGSSLFDAHELSPVKSANKSRKKLSKSNSGDKENLCVMSSPSKRDSRKVKRQILSEKVDNTINISNSPAKDLSFGEDSFRNENKVTYFGFESLSDTPNINEPKLDKKTRDVRLIGKPFRVERYLKLGATCKDKIVDENCEKQDKIVEDNSEILDVNETQENIPIEIPQENGEDLSLTVGLFDDLEAVNKNNVSRKYDRRHRRRVRKHSVASYDENEDEYPQPKKKKKDKRTKEEEEQAEKWAKEFNKMCDEVESFALEIE